MEHARMLVLSIDAMTGDDLRAAAALSNFARLLDGCALATEVLSVFPSLTYPCHVAMATGCWPMHTGVYNNERFLPETRKRPWYFYTDELARPTIFAAARGGRAHGLRDVALHGQRADRHTGAGDLGRDAGCALPRALLRGRQRGLYP